MPLCVSSGAICKIVGPGASALGPPVSHFFTLRRKLLMQADVTAERGALGSHAGDPKSMERGAACGLGSGLGRVTSWGTRATDGDGESA